MVQHEWRTFDREVTMRRTTLLIAVLACLSVSAVAWSTQQTRVDPAPSVDDVIKAVRNDLQGNRADIVAKNVTLTSEQAAKFWPLFEAYQKEQNVMMDAQLKGVQQYIGGFSTMDDATALRLVTDHLANDARMITLRQKWLGEFQKVLPAKLAARVIQIDRRLSLVAQTEIASRLPLIH